MTPPTLAASEAAAPRSMQDCSIARVAIATLRVSSLAKESGIGAAISDEAIADDDGAGGNGSGDEASGESSGDEASGESSGDGARYGATWWVYPGPRESVGFRVDIEAGTGFVSKGIVVADGV